LVYNANEAVNNRKFYQTRAPEITSTANYWRALDETQYLIELNLITHFRVIVIERLFCVTVIC